MRPCHLLFVVVIVGCPGKESVTVVDAAAAVPPVVMVAAPVATKPTAPASAAPLTDAVRALKGINKLRDLVIKRRAHIHVETDDECTQQQNRVEAAIKTASEEVDDARLSRPSRYANAAPNLGLLNATPIVDCLTTCALHVEDVPDQSGIDALRDSCDKATVILSDLENDVRAGK